MVSIKNSKNAFFKAVLNYLKQAIRLEFIIIFAVLLFDTVSKYIVSNFFSDRRYTIIPRFLHISYTRNPNAAFGFCFWLCERQGGPLNDEQMRIFFICFISVTILAFIAFMVWGVKNRPLFRISLAMIVGGAIGNLYCRIFHLSVRDFISIEFFGLRIFGTAFFNTFNLADSALIVGVAMFLIYVFAFFNKDEKLRQERKQAKKLANVNTETEIDPNQTNALKEQKDKIDDADDDDDDDSDFINFLKLNNKN